jgi:putative chitinase
MLTTKGLLDHVAGRDTGDLGRAIADGLDKYCPQYSINTHLRLAHFLAQACEETDRFRTLHEYWGPTPAQLRYEGRADLGNVRPGDGRLYMGRGIFDLTGRGNYAVEGRRLALPLEVEPELAADPVIAARIACDYWMLHGVNAAADADDIGRVTRLINGGLNGLADREAFLARAKEVLP